MLYRFLLFSLLLLFSPFAWAQQVFKYNSPGADCYSEMIFIQQAEKPKAVLVIDTEGMDVVTCSKTSVFSDSLLKKQYNLLYINIINRGSGNIMICYEAIINTYHTTERIYKSAFYVVRKVQNNPQITIIRHDAPVYGFNIINYIDGDFPAFVKTLDEVTRNQSYSIPIESTVSYEIQYAERIKNYKFNSDAGLFFQPFILTGDRLGINRKAISTFGLGYAYNFGRQHAIKLSFEFSFKKPNTSGIQSSLQSKVQSAVQNGDDFVYIDESLSGHMLFGGEIGYRYFFNATKQFRPYFTAGLGQYRLTYMEGRIQDTIDVSNIDMSNPSSMQDALGGNSTGELPDGMINRNSVFTTPFVEFGFQYRLSPVLKVNCAVPFRYFNDTTTPGYSSLTWGFHFGLNFTLNPARLSPAVQLRKP